MLAKKIISITTGLAIAAAMALAIHAFAQTNAPSNHLGGWQGRGATGSPGGMNRGSMMKPGVFDPAPPM